MYSGTWNKQPCLMKVLAEKNSDCTLERLVQTWNHPCFVAPLEIVTFSSGCIVLILPRWDGSLDELAGDMPMEAFSACCSQLFPALEFLHKQGFVHVDIKPDNIVYKRHEGIWTFAFIDFGHLSRAGVKSGYSGTPIYQPRELIEAFVHDKPVTPEPWHDTFGLLASMLYLKTGRLPYGPDMGTSAYVDLVSQNQVGDTVQLCSACRSRLSGDVKFCGQCGFKIVEPVADVKDERTILLADTVVEYLTCAYSTNCKGPLAGCGPRNCRVTARKWRSQKRRNLKLEGKRYTICNACFTALSRISN